MKIYVDNNLVLELNDTQKNIIKTFLGLENDLCIVEISNNGKPIAKGFTHKHLTTRGEKTTDSNGTGVGGDDIQTIVDRYYGIFELDNLTSEDFPVRYIFKFPLVKNIDL